MGKGIHIDNFTGSASNLKKSMRNENGVLYALKRDPRISTFDMSENAWLRDIIKSLESKMLILGVSEPYPWHKWKLTKSGEDALVKVIPPIAAMGKNDG